MAGNQRPRLRKAERFLDTAARALDGSDLDSCASRAYYAAFHACIAMLIVHIDLSAVRWKHATVLSATVHEFAKRRKWLVGVKMRGAKSFSASLRRLHMVREMGDYEIDTVNERMARDSLAFAQALVEAIERRLR